MHNPYYSRLSDMLVNHSIKMKAGHVVLIESTHIPVGMLDCLSQTICAGGGIPLLEIKDHRLFRTILSAGTPEQAEARMKAWGEVELDRMKRCDSYIALRGSENITELSDVPTEHMELYEKHWLKPVHLEQRVNHTNWVVLRWPTPSMAQQAGRSSAAFEDFFFDVCLVDYVAMAKAVEPLRELMDSTDKVRLTAPGTDLRFSIKDIKSVPCTGTHNIPDGECFSAPVRDSVEGTIAFNTPTIYRGTPFDNITLTFKEGRVVSHSSSNDAALEALLDTDEGARYLGEFAVAFHPRIVEPMRDILFDEKIRGSVHLALGDCYSATENGNRSKVHWDLVLRQEQEGGEIWFDDILIRKDGRFVLSSLEPLNPENLE